MIFDVFGWLQRPQVQLQRLIVPMEHRQGVAGVHQHIAGVGRPAVDLVGQLGIQPLEPQGEKGGGGVDGAGRQGSVRR